MYKITPNKIIYSGVATVVFWDDGTKTVVKKAEGTKDDRYNAFCAALAVKMYGTNSALKKYIKAAENAENAKKPTINSAPIKNSPYIKVGDRVRVLDGSQIPHYTGGWCMSDRVGKISTVISIDKEWWDGRKSARLAGECWTFDLRGLEKV